MSFIVSFVIFLIVEKIVEKISGMYIRSIISVENEWILFFIFFVFVSVFATYFQIGSDKCPFLPGKKAMFSNIMEFLGRLIISFFVSIVIYAIFENIVEKIYGMHTRSVMLSENQTIIISIIFFVLLFISNYFKIGSDKKQKQSVRIEEQTRRRAEEEQDWRRAAEDQARRKAEEEQARRRTAEDQARRKAEEEQARKRAEEDQDRRKYEEEQRRKNTVSEEIQKCFSVFELPFSANLDDVKKKYKVMVMVFHPDRHSTNNDVREYAENKTKELNNAFNTLKVKHFNVR